MVPRGARRSDQKTHPSRLEQACRFIPSWSCEFDSRRPLQNIAPSQLTFAVPKLTLARRQGEYGVWNRQEALRLQRQSAAAEKAAERQRRLRETEERVANKVQTLDVRWLSIDGRILFKATVAASETYNSYCALSWSRRVRSQP